MILRNATRYVVVSRASIPTLKSRPSDRQDSQGQHLEDDQLLRQADVEVHCTLLPGARYPRKPIDHYQYDQDDPRTGDMPGHPSPHPPLPWPQDPLSRSSRLGRFDRDGARVQCLGLRLNLPPDQLREAR